MPRNPELPKFKPVEKKPKKAVMSLAIDQDVLDWLRSKGPGHTRYAAELLRWCMEQDLAGQQGEQGDA